MRIEKLRRTSHGETFPGPTSKVVLSQMPVVSNCLPSDWSITAQACTNAPSIDIAAKVAEILRSRMKQKILVSSDVDPKWLPMDGPKFVYDNGFSYPEIEACDGVLTGCTVAIATTGTLALCHSSNGSRRAITLLPDYHLCILEQSSIVETVPEGFRMLEAHRLQPITLISGPSATADIEMTRIQGVHGPRVLDCIIVI